MLKQVIHMVSKASLPTYSSLLSSLKSWRTNEYRGTGELLTLYEHWLKSEMPQEKIPYMKPNSRSQPTDKNKGLRVASYPNSIPARSKGTAGDAG